MSKSLEAYKAIAILEMSAMADEKMSVERAEELRHIIEKELKAKANLVSMCENLAKLVGLKEKDYVELETLITKKLQALENISKAYGNYANYKISEYELIMAVGENTTH